jgi:hypothetical protein
VALGARDYNGERPHSALGCEAPAAFAAELQKQRLAPLCPTSSATQPIVSTARMRKTTAQNFCAVATSYDKLAKNFLAGICIAAVTSFWIKGSRL